MLIWSSIFCLFCLLIISLFSKRSRLDDMTHCKSRNETTNHNSRRNGYSNERAHSTFSFSFYHLWRLNRAQGRQIAVWEGKEAVVEHLEPIWVPQTNRGHLKRSQKESSKEYCPQEAHNDYRFPMDNHAGKSAAIPTNCVPKIELKLNNDVEPACVVFNAAQKCVPCVGNQGWETNES